MHINVFWVKSYQHKPTCQLVETQKPIPNSNMGAIFRQKRQIVSHKMMQIDGQLKEPKQREHRPPTPCELTDFD